MPIFFEAANLSLIWTAVRNHLVGVWIAVVQSAATAYAAGAKWPRRSEGASDPDTKKRRALPTCERCDFSLALHRIGKVGARRRSPRCSGGTCRGEDGVIRCMR